ncbi:MAG TPA: Gfo/Idh/MocA family oxidoreductase [Candidatus Angelobacter sp.]|nr:Gfo/Idh/MocA family oxidoreductase [Candidatus Angelobacter sp.]
MRRSHIEKTESGLKDGAAIPVRIGVLGAGWIAEHVYLPCLLKHSGIEVVAAHDSSPTVLRRFADAAGLSQDALGLEACFSPATDALLLCTPPSAHAGQIAHAVALDKYVLCEKPVVRQITEIEEIEKLGNADCVAGRLMGSATMRYRKDVARLLHWVKSGILGPLDRVRLCWWRERGVPNAGSWRTDPGQSPMGVMEDLGPHLLDLLASLISSGVWNELRVVDASLRCRYGREGRRGASWFKADAGVDCDYVVPDYGYAAFLSDTGTRAEVEVCWANDLPGDFCSLSFEGKNGSAGFRGLLGLSNSRRSMEQQCFLELKGEPTKLEQFPVGPGLQMQAFAESIDIFSGFCRQQRSPAANFFEIQTVAQWLTEIQNASPLEPPDRWSALLPNRSAQVIAKGEMR